MGHLKIARKALPDPFIMSMHEWGSFYLLVGSAAATLVGLLFVALSLAATLLPDLADPESATRVFVTPSLIYFIYVLVLACLTNFAIMNQIVFSAIIGATSIAGLLFVVPRGRALKGNNAQVPADDRLWYAALPALSYVLLLAGAIALFFSSDAGLTLLAVASTFFLLAGIRNAWDLMLWIGKQKKA
jgi:hypothetical protein